MVSLSFMPLYVQEVNTALTPNHKTNGDNKLLFILDQPTPTTFFQYN